MKETNTHTAVTEIPRPEHPRPDFMRQPWINLNGAWRFTFDPRNVGEQDRWHRVTHPELRAETGILNTDPFGDHIIVPFPWESALSGIGETDYKGAAWYQRLLEVPASWATHDAPPQSQAGHGLPGMEEAAQSPAAPGANVDWRVRPFLCFGAVDWSAKVWINGRFVGEHVGGYTPFELDISRYVHPGKPVTLTVRVYDACDADTLLGKQTTDWYTHSGGIWQTVWLEGRAATHIQHIHVMPNIESGEALFTVTVAGAEDYACCVTISSPNGEFPDAQADVTAEGIVSLPVRVPNPRLWSPEAPHLYDTVVRLSGEDKETRRQGEEETEANTPPIPSDEVVTYFGLRSVGRGQWKDKPYEYVLLNGEPVYLRGALDQAFTPEGLHTYPTDEAIRQDIQIARDMGLNMLRCHIKINDPRYYYWADKLGVLMMYDIPSASLYTPTARAHWEATMRAAFERDASHPCIIAWILFNETWGLEEHQTPASWNWVREMFALAKSLDATRIVEDNSPCVYDHVQTDINTWHFYIGNYDRARRHVQRVVDLTYEGSPFNYVGHELKHVAGSEAYKQGIEPLLNSEYAGLGADGGDKDISYTFKYLTTELRRHAKICGYVYTELTDIEWEHNGFVNYDRSGKGYGYADLFPGMNVSDLNGADFIGLDCAPCVTLMPGSAWSAPLFVSHWDKRRMETAHVCWQITSIDSLGETHLQDEGRREVHLEQYDVTDAGVLTTQCPDENALLTVAFWLEDAHGTVRARNYVNIDVHDGQPLKPVEWLEKGVALRFAPGDYLETSRPNPTVGAEGNKFICGGPGWIDYAVKLPEDLDANTVQGLRVVFEAGARTAGGRMGWRRTWHDGGRSYPQTHAMQKGSKVHVSVNGISLGEAAIADDPADARGVLSLHLYEAFEFASYGFLTTLRTDAETAQKILAVSKQEELIVRFEVPRAAGANGLNLYGARMGAYPVAPTVCLDLE